MSTTKHTSSVVSTKLVSPELCEQEEWDDTKLRHAYLPNNHETALCGYAGPCTWANEIKPPPNVCPICLAILPEYWDGARWIRTDESSHPAGSK